jgi:hypothetical protein
MAKKKKSRERSPARKKKAAAKRSPRKQAQARKSKKAAARKTAARKAPARKATARKATARKKTVRKTTSRPTSWRPRGGADSRVESPLEERGLGPEAGGQSGDTEGLSREELAASESVEELLEEGQAFEAGVVSGVENAPDADEGEVRTREVPEDDVPQEYLDKD